MLILGMLVSGCDGDTSPLLLAPPDITLTDQEKTELAAGLKPESWFLGQLKGPREKLDGDPLDPKLQFLFEQTRPAASAETFKSEMALFATAEGRAAIRSGTDRRWTVRTALSSDMASVEDRTVKGRGGNDIPIRIYRPKVADAGALPVLVYFHGGGFVFASIKAMDRAVRLMANEAGMIVVSVDYRLAPETPYPAAHDDAEDAWLWVRANAASLGGDPERLAMGGDSAGGHLTAVTSLRQVAAGRPGPLYQLLYYPALTMETDDGSYRLFSKGYGLDRPFIDAVIGMAFPDPATRASPEGSPLNAHSLKGMPATILVTAGFDPLRDQGRRFARRLEEDGVSVTYLNYGSLTHSFLNWSGVIGEAEHAARQTASLLGQAIRSRPGALATGN
ncbi:alpha/beta hydrolase [Niveispirillum sp. KHB5.9]|uniref:alpha/beta hydrolase n=1 Tax=Niveispirillum sp. KHB5.9 TaxID=3400269 RepID=UPI003A855653